MKAPATADWCTAEEIIRAQAALCALVTRFQSHRCPKLAHLIVQRIRRLLAQPGLAHAPGARDLYLQMLEHWQTVSASFAPPPSERHRPVTLH